MIRVEVKLLEQEMMLYIMDKTTKNLAWNTFKQTGNIDTFMELIQVENIEKNMAKNIRPCAKEPHCLEFTVRMI